MNSIRISCSFKVNTLRISFSFMLRSVAACALVSTCWLYSSTLTNHPAPQFGAGVTVAPFKRIDQHRGIKIALAEVVTTNAVKVENHSVGHGFPFKVGLALLQPLYKLVYRISKHFDKPPNCK